MIATCSIDGCAAKVRARGWCTKHWKRWRYHGDPLFLTRKENGSAIRFLNSIAIPYTGDDCLFWPHTRDRYGYPRMVINKKNTSVSRYLCEHKFGQAPTELHQAAHNCGNGYLGCCNPKHLRWATRTENESDKIIHGTKLRGSLIGNSKLTESDVKMIISMKGKYLQREIAEMFGVKQMQISRILRGERWSWLTNLSVPN